MRSDVKVLEQATSYPLVLQYIAAPRRTSNCRRAPTTCLATRGTGPKHARARESWERKDGTVENSSVVLLVGRGPLGEYGACRPGSGPGAARVPLWRFRRDVLRVSIIRRRLSRRRGERKRYERLRPMIRTEWTTIGQILPPAVTLHSSCCGSRSGAASRR